jgi:hypothetical protein
MDLFGAYFDDQNHKSLLFSSFGAFSDMLEMLLGHYMFTSFYWSPKPSRYMFSFLSPTRLKLAAGPMTCRGPRSKVLCMRSKDQFRRELNEMHVEL